MNILKLILLTTTALIIVSCNNSKQTSRDKGNVNFKIETYIDSLDSNYAGFETNDVIKEELNDFLKNDFKKAIDKGVLTDLPFKLNKVEKCGTQYMLVLEHSLTSKLYDRGLLSDLEIDLYAFTDEKTAKSLIEGQFYLVEVEYKDYITFQNNKKYCALVLLSPFMGHFDHEIQFGAISVKLKKIEVTK